MLRKIAVDSYECLGDTTSPADPAVLDHIIAGHRNLVAGRHETEHAPDEGNGKACPGHAAALAAQPPRTAAVRGG